ncbi:MAG TPA: hypothetical protein PK257_01865 [Candidatus Woesebacteria bacterium]|nr:hypothetical protein [Candidatus Woesebacteria bacterium]
MLPKVEKIKKNSEDQNSDQPGLFDKENEKERLIKKRRFVYIAMALTIGLSLFFWIYRLIRNIDFSFKMPKFNFSVSVPKNNNINLPQDGAVWSVFLKRVNPDLIIYQSSENFLLSDEKLNNSKLNNSSIYTSSLPEGLKTKELMEETEKSFSYLSKITTPSQELFLVVKVDNSSDLSQSKKLLPGLIDQLYWYSLQK